MEAKIITHAEHQAQTASCAHTVAEAAKKLHVSEATIRRTCRKLGVRRVAGPTVKAYVCWPMGIASVNGTLPVVLPFCE